jgi:hypothetical protein
MTPGAFCNRQAATEKNNRKARIACKNAQLHQHCCTHVGAEAAKAGEAAAGWLTCAPVELMAVRMAEPPSKVTRLLLKVHVVLVESHSWTCQAQAGGGAAGQVDGQRYSLLAAASGVDESTYGSLLQQSCGIFFIKSLVCGCSHILLF